MGIAVKIFGDQLFFRTEKMPFIDFCEYSLSFALISCLLVSRDSVATKSTSETLGVGTRIAKPSSLPFISGITSAMARRLPLWSGSWKGRRREPCSNPYALRRLPPDRWYKNGSLSLNRIPHRIPCAGSSQSAPGNWWCRIPWR